MRPRRPRPRRARRAAVLQVARVAALCRLVPVPAVVLGLHGRGDRAPRRGGRAGAGAPAAGRCHPFGGSGHDPVPVGSPWRALVSRAGRTESPALSSLIGSYGKTRHHRRRPVVPGALRLPGDVRPEAGAEAEGRPDGAGAGVGGAGGRPVGRARRQPPGQARPRLPARRANAAAAPPAAPAPAAAPEVADTEEREVVIETATLRAVFTNRGARPQELAPEDATRTRPASPSTSCRRRSQARRGRSRIETGDAAVDARANTALFRVDGDGAASRPEDRRVAGSPSSIARPAASRCARRSPSIRRRTPSTRSMTAAVGSSPANVGGRDGPGPGRHRDERGQPLHDGRPRQPVPRRARSSATTPARC